MTYSYAAQKPAIFTEKGQVMFLKIRDRAQALLNEAGAVMSGNLLNVCVGDTWDMLACIDRLVELGELIEVTGKDVAGQHRIFKREVGVIDTADLIRTARRPLPAHELMGVNFRRWAVAVCSAEVEHSREDFWRAVHASHAEGLFDRDDGEGEHEALYRLPHERYALASLNWLSCLLTHEADKYGPWRVVRWDIWDDDRRAEWWERWFTLWDGFCRNVEKYRLARKEAL